MKCNNLRFSYLIIFFLLVVPGQIESLKVTDISINSVNVTWSPPNISNGVVLYRVFYSNRDRDNCDTAVMFVNVTRNTYLEILNLEEYILYKFIVQPFTNEGGNGTITSIEERTKPLGKDLRWSYNWINWSQAKALIY